MGKKSVSVWDRPFDVEVITKNLRESKSSMRTGYRPVFEISENYYASGVIDFIDCEWLEYNNETRAYVRFLTPEVYPKSLWIGRKIVFGEGQKVTGYAIVTQIFNNILKMPVP